MSFGMTLTNHLEKTNVLKGTPAVVLSLCPTPSRSLDPRQCSRVCFSSVSQNPALLIETTVVEWGPEEK